MVRLPLLASGCMVMCVAAQVRFREVSEVQTVAPWHAFKRELQMFARQDTGVNNSAALVSSC